jgi:hypothetical protein
MKRFFTSFLIMVTLAVAPVTAQVHFGVKGGINTMEMKFKPSVFDTGNRVGWFIGPTLKANLSFIGFDVSALYDQRKAKVGDETFQAKSIDIPVNLRVNIGLGSSMGIYAGLGPQFSFNVGDDKFSWTSRNSYRNTFQMKKSTFSMNYGAGIYLSRHLELGFTYNVVLGKTAELKDTLNAIKDGEDLETRSWTLNAAVYF